MMSNRNCYCEKSDERLTGRAARGDNFTTELLPAMHVALTSMQMRASMSRYTYVELTSFEPKKNKKKTHNLMLCVER